MLKVGGEREPGSRLLRPARLWRDPSLLLGAALAGMLAAGFLLPTGSAWADLFYVVVGPCVLVSFWRGKFSDNWRDPGYFLPIALIVWTTLSVFWCSQPSRRNDLYLVDGFCTLLFFVGLVTALRRPGLARTIGDVLVAFGALNAGISLATYPMRNGWGGRLWGLGETRQAILGASILAVAVIFALARVLLLEDRRTPTQAIFYLAAAAVLIAFIAMSQSRGPLAGLTAALLVLTFFSRHRRRIIPSAAGLLFLLWCADGATGGRWITRAAAKIVTTLAMRGTSYRPAIWHASLAQISEHPWIGRGAGATLGFESFTFPHDLYLSLLFYTGAVGLVLFLTLAARLIAGIIRRDAPDRGLLLALWANMLVSGLTDYGQIIKGPSPLWYIVWVPIAFSVAFAVPRRDNAALSRHGAGMRSGAA